LTGQEVAWGGGGTLTSIQKTRSFANSKKDVTSELGRSGSHNSWCRSMGATIGLIETTCEELLKL